MKPQVCSCSPQCVHQIPSSKGPIREPAPGTNFSGLLKNLTRPFDLLTAQRRTPDTHKVLASYLGISRPAFPVDISLRGGGVIRAFTRGELKVFWSIFVDECYRLWADSRTILDAGANIGVFSVWAARKLPRATIIAIEPHPETFSRLRHNIYANQFESRVQIMQFALSAETVDREMPAAGESQRRALFPQDRSGTGNVVRVPSTTLADLMDRHQLPTIDLLKMDIEGSEWEVLLSTPASVLQRIRRMQFEYHEVHARFGYSKAGLFKHLSNAGFSITESREDRHGTGIAVAEQTERGKAT